MPTFMRVEFSRSLRPDTSRFVLMIEIPDNVASELKPRKVSHETRATSRSEKTNPRGVFVTKVDLTLFTTKNLALKQDNVFTVDGSVARATRGFRDPL
jgi:hypothetical protein